MSTISSASAAQRTDRARPVDHIRHDDYTTRRQKANEEKQATFGPAVNVTLSKEAQDALKRQQAEKAASAAKAQ